MKNLRKAITVGVMSVTVLSMSMLMVPMTVGAQAQAGDLIKMDGLSSVYYLGADGKRYVFPNETTYFSWYSDFSGVVTVPQSELESYPLGANVTMRSGTSLVKITTDPKVYAVLPGGSLLWVPDEATALALYGANWAGMVVDVPDAFFTNYTVDPSQASETAYPAGSLVKFGGGADVYYVNADGTASKVADEAAFAANRFSWDDVIDSTMAVPTAGTEIAGANATLIDTSQGAGGTAGAGTGLTVSLASDTPAASNIPLGSPTEFLKINLTASADGDVTVNTLKLSAYELGTATNIDNVTIYRDGVKQGNAKNINSDREATFNFATPIVVPAGTTVSLVVKATITGTASNYAIGITAVSDVTTNGAVVSGSFPIIGNTKVIVTGGTIGTLTLPTVDGTDTANVEFGEADVLLASFNLAAANEAIIWESLQLRNGGTNNDTLATNLRLLVDGDEIATGNLVNRYTEFGSLNYIITKNDTISVEVYGDMGIGNVGDTVILYLKEGTDIVSTGQSFGYGIALTDADNWNTTTEGKEIGLIAGDFTIAMDKSATPAKEVRSGDTNVVLATIKMASNGENATVSQIADSGSDDFIISGTGLNCNEFDNVELRDTTSGALFDIAVASGTTDYICALTMSDEMSFIKGVVRIFELRVDLDGSTDDNEIDNNDTLQVTLEDGALSGNITGDESNASLTNITPSSVSSAVSTVKAASLTWTTTALTDKTVVPGAQDVIIYKALLDVGDSSQVELTKVRFDVDNSNYETFHDDNIASMELYLDGKLLGTKSNSIVNDGATGGYVIFNSLTSANRVIPAGGTVYIELIADFSASFTNAPADFALEIVIGGASIVAKDVDNNAVGESLMNAGTDSRLVNLASTGTLKVDMKTDDAKADVNTILLAGGTTAAGRYLGEMEFTTANESVKVKTLTLERTNLMTFTDSDIGTVNVYDSDDVMVAQGLPNANGDVHFSTFNYILPADQVTSLFIGVTAKGINVDGDPLSTATHDRTVDFNFATSGVYTAFGVTSAITAEGVDSSDAITMTQDPGDNTLADNEYAAATSTTNTTTLSGSVLTSVVNTMDDGVLTGGTGKIIGKYKFQFDNGSNRTSGNVELKAQLVELQLTVSTSTAVVSDIQAYIEGSSANKTTAVNTVAGVATINLDEASKLPDSALVDGEVTLVIIGDINGVGTNDYVQTEINNLNGDFTYDGNNGSDGSDTSNALLDISEVLGGTLSN